MAKNLDLDIKRAEKAVHVLRCAAEEFYCAASELTRTWRNEIARILAAANAIESKL